MWPLLLLCAAGGRRRRRSHCALAVAWARSPSSRWPYARPGRRGAEQAYFSSPPGRGSSRSAGSPRSRRSAARSAARAPRPGWAGVAAIGIAAAPFGGPPPSRDRRAAADARRRRAARRRLARSRLAPDAGRCTPPGRRVGRVSYAWYSGTGRCSSSRPRRGARCRPPSAIAVVDRGAAARDGRPPLDRGAAAPLEAPRPPAAPDARRRGRGSGPGGRVRPRALREPLVHPAARCARVEGAPQLDRTHAIQPSASGLRPRPATPTLTAAARRGRLSGVRARESSARVATTATGTRRTPSSCSGLPRHAAVPRARADRARAPLAARRADEGGCPPPRLRVITRSPAARTGSATRGATTRCGGSREERAFLVVATSSAHYTVLDGRAPARPRRGRAGAGRGVGADAAAPAPRRAPRGRAERPATAAARRPGLRVGRHEGPATLRVPAARGARAVAPVDAAIRRVKGITTIDPTSRFCLPEVCPR